MKYKNCIMDQWVKEKKLNFNTLFIPCINLYNVYQEYNKIINAEKANEHMPGRIQEKNY